MIGRWRLGGGKWSGPPAHFKGHSLGENGSKAQAQERTMSGIETGDLSERIEKWLNEEGYPLEYFTASQFRAAGLSVRQGTFFRPSPDASPRELDVVASASLKVGERRIRIETVVECKWSRAKPTIVFTSSTSRLSPSACISQTIASEVGDALLWITRGNEEVRRTAAFLAPEQPGFGGRQAFAQNDKMYAAIASVTGACAKLAALVDRGYENVDNICPYCLIYLPVIVIDGPLFAATSNDESGKMTIDEVPQIRLHWSGSSEWPLHATIDVVTREALPAFAKQRGEDCNILLRIFARELVSLVEAIRIRDKSFLRGSRGGSGRGDLPKLLRNLF